MESPSLVLLSNQQALQRAMDIVANNIANSSTTGFKREGVEFDTLVMHPSPGQELSFIVDRATYRDASNGPIVSTGNPLDLAIQGQGYFPVQTPAGTRYTRAGALRLDTSGQIVTMDGNPVLGEGDRPISVPDTTTEITIGADGFVSAKIDNGKALAQVGKLSVVKFDNEQALQPAGGGLYSTTQAAKPAEDSSVVQFAIEQSNVQPITEMTEMIRIQRAYEQTANIISRENQRLSDAISRLSKTTA